MLYKKSNSEQLDNKLFINPTKEYRGVPFWAWNCKLDADMLKRQIGYFKEMGFGGFMMHARIGLATKYLGDEFMDIVKRCVDEGKRTDMLAYLYDEDRWPSGFAGGLVTKNIRYRAKMLAFTTQKPDDLKSKETALKEGYKYFISAFDVKIDDNGYLLEYNKININEEAKHKKWYAYVLIGEPDPWYNNTFYVDTMDREAVQCFLETTYEKYKSEVGDEFGKSIPAIFSDEPNCGSMALCLKTGAKQQLEFATKEQPVGLKWSTNFDEEFENMFGYDITGCIPELVFDIKDTVSKVRYDYYECLSELFVQSYADQVGKWCSENNIAFTGHLWGEDVLINQINNLGETMRSYRSFNIPGIDVLCDGILLNCGKQVQSVAHQRGINAVASELYGVTNWEFDFRDHKFQGDWQAALGITLRIPHVSWASMAGEGKRDYPASINYQSPWYKEYKNIEDHFARVNTALTRGTPIVKLAVIHPVETGWLYQGPSDINSAKIHNLDAKFKQLTEWLLGNHIDFDFICESQLPHQCAKGTNPLKVGEMEYDAVLVANCDTIRSTTVERLSDFSDGGGILVFAGKCPKYVDAGSNEGAKKLFERANQVNYDKIEINEALSEIRQVDIRNANGSVAENLIYNMRRDNDCRWLFIARKDRVTNKKVVPPQEIIITLNGKFNPVVYDTVTGDIKDTSFCVRDNKTIIYYSLDVHSSLLLKLNKKTVDKKSVANKKYEVIKKEEILDTVEFELDEPNVLVLDRAEISVDGGEFMPEEEVLKAESKIRKLLNYESREELSVQPYIYGDDKPNEHRLTLRYKIKSDIEVENPVLAIEDAEMINITLNGENVINTVSGYYVDEAIKKVNLPKIGIGENILLIDMPFGPTMNVECCYILGDFGVDVAGSVASIVRKKDKIGFSSIIYQGMPFYGGGITYKMKINTPGGKLRIQVSDYLGAIMNVVLDGKFVGKIIFAPYTLEIDNVSQGKHTVEFTLLAHRGNTFGTMHLNNPSFRWYSSEAWRKLGEEWCYEYHLTDIGIMKSPVFETIIE